MSFDSATTGLYLTFCLATLATNVIVECCTYILQPYQLLISPSRGHATCSTGANSRQLDVLEIIHVACRVDWSYQHFPIHAKKAKKVCQLKIISVKICQEGSVNDRPTTNTSIAYSRKHIRHVRCSLWPCFRRIEASRQWSPSFIVSSRLVCRYFVVLTSSVILRYHSYLDTRFYLKKPYYDAQIQLCPQRFGRKQ